MKIGLLLCDHVREEFLDIQGDYPDMFQALLPQLDFEVIEVCRNQFPAKVEDFDAYLATGSRFSVYDELEWIAQLKVFVRDLQRAGKPYIGVCFGHQMLAEALGGQVKKADTGWAVGIHSLEIHQQESWMEPTVRKMNLLMMCQDQVVRLPEGSTILASAKQCPVGMFKIGKNMLGIQAHPEFSRDYDQALMEARFDRMGIDTVKAGIESLAQTIHRFEIQQWMINFLKNA